MANRYHKFWVSDELVFRLFHFPKTITKVWVSMEELKEYLKKTRKKLIVQEFEEECERGHTYRQIMGFEALDCECCNDTNPTLV